MKIVTASSMRWSREHSGHSIRVKGGGHNHSRSLTIGEDRTDTDLHGFPRGGCWDPGDMGDGESPRPGFFQPCRTPPCHLGLCQRWAAKAKPKGRSRKDETLISEPDEWSSERVDRQMLHCQIRQAVPSACDTGRDICADEK
jgi:hypothetical protein